MTASRTTVHDKPADSTQAVEAFMLQLEHPLKPAIELLRKLMLGFDPSVREGIKWNAPSFRTSEYFATTYLRSKTGIGLILHLGAKVREPADGGVAINDPDKLLKWLGKDRAMLEFASADELEGKKPALIAVLRQWIRSV